jgi:organic radical activating enzyme
MEYNIANLVVTVLMGVGIGIGLVALYVWHVIRKFKAEIDQVVEDTVRLARDSLVGVVLEEDAGQLYCYRESDRQFLCQGVNITEIRTKFAEQYPDKTAYLSGGDPALLERLKAELEQITQKEQNEAGHSV